MTLAIIDLETTGLDPQKHEIIEIGCVVDTPRGYMSESWKVAPQHIETADPEALAVNGYTEEKWKDALPLELALASLNNLVPVGACMMAYNISFDRAFLEKAYRDVGAAYPFNRHHLDLLTLAWMHTPNGQSLSLKAVCEYFEIEPEPEEHRALAGAMAAYEVYKKLITKI